ncbi:uncharacterized protein LOC107021382 [Solanum pennellii]|uniref:Uncharacterized protein LOC107021382 n=1 Tax=Solanum pennellii TaxID=28526 RepID=A0ABM1GXX9_SOLPN|nr:uncharacterized protein LOC107021382 [Solanum pennellii]
MAFRLRDFTRMNPPMFFGSKVNEDSQDFSDEVYKILYVTGVSSNEKTELDANQLKDVAQTSVPGGRRGNSLSEKPTCTKSGKKHIGECLVRTGNCFACGKNGNKVRDCPVFKDTGRESNKEKARGSSTDASKKNHFYALRSRGEREDSHDVVTICSKCSPLMSMLY